MTESGSDSGAGALDEWDVLYGDITRQRIIEGDCKCSTVAAIIYCKAVTRLPEDVFATLSDVTQNHVNLVRSARYGEPE